MRWLVCALLIGCPLSTPEHTPELDKSTVTVNNKSKVDTTVYVTFGAESVVLPSGWSFCRATSNLSCFFPLAAGEAKNLPISGKYFNATVSFFKPVTCSTTKAEVNVNNPKWYDVGDISLVDGFNVPLRMRFSGENLVVASATGNEKTFGVYPNGCDICVARENPPCGMTPGSDGCKSGGQYNPDVPCQIQGDVMGGGDNDVLIELLELEPT